MAPEQRARQQIDSSFNSPAGSFRIGLKPISAGPGVAIREALLKTGGANYLPFVGGKAIATVEAKPEGYTLADVEGQRQHGEGPLWQIFRIEPPLQELTSSRHELQ